MKIPVEYIGNLKLLAKNLRDGIEVDRSILFEQYLSVSLQEGQEKGLRQVHVFLHTLPKWKYSHVIAVNSPL